jgi:aldehyde:ferredoxin oxidoreductase
MAKGYLGRVLNVDLSNRKIGASELPEGAVLRKFNGGYGLGLKYLMDQIKPGTGPFDRNCPLIFFTGPLTATAAPAATNLTAISINGDNEFTAARSHTHGFFGVNLKWAGYDGIILTGRCEEEPLYLLITKDKVELKSAKHLWGKDTYETQDLLMNEYGLKKPGGSVLAIGPAGENLVGGAMICNDRNHSFSHSAMGMVMGWKRLKAMVVSGKSEPMPLADPEKFKKIAEKWRSVVLDGSVAAVVAGGAIPKSEMQGLKDMGLLTHNNFSGEPFPEYAIGMSKNGIKPQPCWGCPIGCGYRIEILHGPEKGLVAYPCGGAENMEGVGSNLGIADPGTNHALLDMCDRYGMESGHVGCSIGVAVEAYQRGILTNRDTDGLELEFGNAETMKKLIRKIAYREGLGDLLSKGPKRVADILGLPGSAVHIKGSSMNNHDWRSGWGTLLGQAVGTGSGWFSGGCDTFGNEPSIGYPEKLPPDDWRGQAASIKATSEYKIWAADCAGMCWFGVWGVKGGADLVAEAISAATGWDFSKQEGLKVGARVIAMERVFAIERGLTPEDDYKLSERLLEPPKYGPVKGKSIRPHLEGMVREYYELKGWDRKTGKPWRSTLDDLDLGHLGKKIWAE